MAISQLLLATIYLFAARAAGAASYGEVVAAVALGLASVGVIDLGTGGLWSRELAAGRLSFAEYSRRVVWKVVYSLTIALAWAIVAVVLVPGTPFWVSGFVACASSFAQTIQAGLNGRGRTELAGVAMLLDRVIGASLFLLFWMGGIEALSAFVMALVGGATAGGLIANRYLLGDCRVRLCVGRPINPWKGVRNFALANVSIAAQGYDVALIGIFGGASAAGVYAAVNRWTQPLLLPALAFNFVLAPYLANASSTKLAVHRMRSGMWLLCLSLVGIGLVILFAPIVVGLLLGDEYAESENVLRLLAAGAAVAVISLPLYSLLMARRHDRTGGMWRAISVCMALGLAAVLSSRFGAIGGGAAYLIGQLILLLGVTVGIARLALGTRARVVPGPR